MSFFVGRSCCGEYGFHAFGKVLPDNQIDNYISQCPSRRSEAFNLLRH